MTVTPSQVLPLWVDPAPGALGDSPEDIPRIDVYLPMVNPTQTGVLIYPGGGYKYLSAEHEGSEVAEWLNGLGIAAFVVHYRVAPYKHPVPLLDGARAMRQIRFRALEFGLLPNRLGVWGFSAGGHVASTLMTNFDAALKDGCLEAVDQVSDRPSFGILAYPVISMNPEITHSGSHDILLGMHPMPELEEQYSNELHVKANSPPAFLFATSDDSTVPVANSVCFYLAYVGRKLPVEMHLFEHGSHGAGLGGESVELQEWPLLLASWMLSGGWIAR